MEFDYAGSHYSYHGKTAGCGAKTIGRNWRNKQQNRMNILNTNRESFTWLKGEIKHEDCCPLLTRLDPMNGSNGSKYVARGRKPAKE